MKISDELNLVIPLGSKDEQMWAYHKPISQDVFKSNYFSLAAVKAELMAKGAAFTMDAGPRIAALMLTDEARKEARKRGDLDGNGDGSDASARSLLAEIRRLTTIVKGGSDGYEQTPADVSLQRGKVDKDDWEELESALVFFTCFYAMERKRSKEETAKATSSLFQGFVTSLSITDWINSLQMLSRGESTEAPTAPAKVVSSVPV